MLVLDSNVADGMYSGVRMVLLTVGSETFSSTIGMFIGSPISTVSISALAFFILAPIFLLGSKLYGQVKQIVSTYPVEKTEEKLIINNWKIYWSEKVQGPAQVREAV